MKGGSSGWARLDTARACVILRRDLRERERERETGPDDICITTSGKQWSVPTQTNLIIAGHYECPQFSLSILSDKGMFTDPDPGQTVMREACPGLAGPGEHCTAGREIIPNTLGTCNNTPHINIMRTTG